MVKSHFLRHLLRLYDRLLQAPSRRTVTLAVHQRDIAGYEGLPLIVKFRCLIEFLIYSYKLLHCGKLGKDCCSIGKGYKKKWLGLNYKLRKVDSLMSAVK